MPPFESDCDPAGLYPIFIVDEGKRRIVTTTIHDHHPNNEPDSPELSLLFDDFRREHLTPLWTQLDDLMPMHPTPRALPYVWR